MGEHKTNESFKDQIIREQVRLAMKQLPAMQAASFVVVLVLAFAVRDIAHRAFIIGWLVMILVVVASRILLHSRFKQVRSGLFDGSRWQKAYVTLAFLSGTFWGLSAFLIFPTGNLGLISLFVLVMASLSATTTISHSSIRLAPAAWAGPAMAPYAVRCVMGGGESGYTLGFLIALYLATILRYSLIQNSAITSAISLRFENLALLSEVQRSQEVLEKTVETRTFQLQQANETLMKEIEERRLLAAALRQSEERFRELADLLPETIFEMNMDGKLTYVNQSGLDNFGYSQEDVEGGLNGFDIIAPEDRLRAHENAEKILKGEKTGLIEYNTTRKDGSVFPALIRSSTKLQGGEPVGIRGIVIDMTESKHLEAQLRQAQKMEAIGTLAGGIAHDFNNILAAVIGYTEIVQNEVPKESSAQQDLDQVLKATYRARDLVRQILAFSRMNAEQEPAPVEVCKIVREALQMLRASIPTTIDMIQDLNCENCVTFADPTQIHQILVNLCANAAQAMRERGGVLKIGLEVIHMDLSRDTGLDLKPGSYVRLAVSDTGPGMDAATRERVFDPYFTTKNMGEGTGLGLAVVHGIVKRYNGAIGVRSETGKGATFYVYLPSFAGAVAESEDSESPILEGNEYILFVDDEVTMITIGTRILELLGYTVVAKTSSREALETFRSSPDRFDLLITDYTMPEMTGGQLAEEILKIRPNMRILMCTGFNEQISDQLAREMGIAGFILKPVNRREMALAVRNALRKA